MIKSFGDSEAAKIWHGERSRKLPGSIQNIARRKLRMINNSSNINDLRVPPGNRLEKLKGHLKRYHSIRINDQWRIVFRWNRGDAYELKIIDYHG